MGMRIRVHGILSPLFGAGLLVAALVLMTGGAAVARLAPTRQPARRTVTMMFLFMFFECDGLMTHI